METIGRGSEARTSSCKIGALATCSWPGSSDNFRGVGLGALFWVGLGPRGLGFSGILLGVDYRECIQCGCGGCACLFLYRNAWGPFTNRALASARSPAPTSPTGWGLSCSLLPFAVLHNSITYYTAGWRSVVMLAKSSHPILKGAFILGPCR